MTHDQSKHAARRDNITEQNFEAGLHLAVREGVNPALDFMERVGIPRPVALRVLCGPKFKPQLLRHNLN